MIDSIWMQPGRQNTPMGEKEAVNRLITSPFGRNDAELLKHSNVTMCQTGHCKLLGSGFCFKLL